MKHLTPYEQGAPRFRRVDLDEMDSLMSADAFAYLTEAKTAAILAALAHAFPGQWFNAIEFRLSGPLSMSTMHGEGPGGLDGLEVRKHTSGYLPKTWVHREREGGDANNLFVAFGDQSLPWIPKSLDAFPSKDDYFYVKISYDSDNSDSEPMYVVCDGMRGLLDLVGSLGRGDI